jgi:Uma2 family endonuclease
MEVRPMKRAQRSAIVQPMSPEEFLAWEREQPRDRHIFIDGEVIAVRGASVRHNALTASAIVLLDRSRDATHSRVFASQMRVELPNENFVYPDALVVCGRLEVRPGTDDVLVNPTLVLEVLSKSTERLDRGTKLRGYLALRSLRHYVLVSQAEVRVEVYSRLEPSGFRFDVFEAGTSIGLEGIHADLGVDELYRGVFELPGA